MGWTTKLKTTRINEIPHRQNTAKNAFFAYQIAVSI